MLFAARVEVSSRIVNAAKGTEASRMYALILIALKYQLSLFCLWQDLHRSNKIKLSLHFKFPGLLRRPDAYQPWRMENIEGQQRSHSPCMHLHIRIFLSKFSAIILAPCQRRCCLLHLKDLTVLTDQLESPKLHFVLVFDKQTKGTVCRHSRAQNYDLFHRQCGPLLRQVHATKLPPAGTSCPAWPVLWL